MSVIVRIDSRVDGTMTEVDGCYLVSYDPTITDGQYTLVTSPTLKHARVFDTLQDAIAYVRQVSPNVPEDRPGHANRPLTVYNLEFIPEK
jgi:hypothetical protein